MNGEDEKQRAVNTGRQFEVDCIKFFAIFFMICVHIYEMLGKYDFYHTMPDGVFRNWMEFAGGPLAAPVFMFSMGIGMVYTRHKTYKEFLKRGLKLLIIGYTLNFFRETLLEILGITILGLDYSFDQLVNGWLNIDILEFAGIAFLTVGLMKKFKIRTEVMLVISIILQAIGIWALRLSLPFAIVRDLLGLFIPTDPVVCFPLTLWLIYPVSGIAFGEILQRTENKGKLYGKLLLIGVTGVSAMSSIIWFTGNDVRMMYALIDDTYYHQNLISSIWTVSVVFIALSLDYFLLRKLDNTVVRKLVEYCSMRINKIYIVQWLLIAYLVAIVTALEIEGRLSAGGIILVGMTVSFVAIGIATLLGLIIQKMKTKKAAKTG